MARLETGPAVTCMKILLTIFNAIFLISGVVILALGIWYVVDLHNYLDLGGQYNKASSIVLISTGALILLVGVLACCCTIKAKYGFPLYLYCAFLCVVFLAELASGISLFVFKSDLEDDFSSSFNQTIQTQYNAKQKEMDKLQEKLECCGAYNYTDWFSAGLVSGNHSVPTSCCRSTGCNTTGLPYLDPSGNLTAAIYTEGCASKIIDILNKNIAKIGGAAIGFAMLQLVGALLACCLGRAVSKANYEQIN